MKTASRRCSRTISAAAKQAFDAALKKNPDDADALYYEGVRPRRRGTRARGEVLQERHQAPPRPRVGLGEPERLLRRRPAYDDAIAVGKAALARHADNAALHANVGIAYAGKNDAAKATSGSIRP